MPLHKLKDPGQTLQTFHQASKKKRNQTLQSQTLIIRMICLLRGSEWWNLSINWRTRCKLLDAISTLLIIANAILMLKIVYKLNYPFVRKWLLYYRWKLQRCVKSWCKKEVLVIKRKNQVLLWFDGKNILLRKYYRHKPSLSHCFEQQPMAFSPIH